MGTQQTVRLISVVASGALAARRMVDFDSSGDVAYPSAGSVAAGVLQEAADAADKVISAALPDGAIVKVEAGAAVALGADVMSNATGQAITATATNTIMGKALQAAGALGDIIEVQLINRGLAT